MGDLHPPEDVELIIGLLASDTSYFNKAEKILARHFGPIEYESALLPFTQSTYYDAELGGRILRKFISFRRLHSLEKIYKTKLITNRIEQKFASNGRRHINIDPGYIDLAKLVLLTTKDYSHRIYLKGSIYAEITLYFQSGSYRPWSWTYPDYQTSDYIAIFDKIRQIYKNKLEKLC